MDVDNLQRIVHKRFRSNHNKIIYPAEQNILVSDSKASVVLLHRVNYTLKSEYLIFISWMPDIFSVSSREATLFSVLRRAGFSLITLRGNWLGLRLVSLSSIVSEARTFSMSSFPLAIRLLN